MPISRNSKRSNMAMENAEFRNPVTHPRYLAVRPENGGILDLIRLLVSKDGATASRFVESSDPKTAEFMISTDYGEEDYDEVHKFAIFLSIIVRKMLMVLRKPLEWIGYFTEFLLNLISLNGSLFSLFFKFFQGKVVKPERGSETFISTIGHVDGRIDLYNNQPSESDTSFRFNLQIENRALMDLSVMSAKLAYENVNVVRNVVNQHWKMHFVDFYDCWNDREKERSTQVFILCDKPNDADLIVISFRGTEPFDVDDWSTDFDYSWYEILNVGKVHMGFLEAMGLGNKANATTFTDSLAIMKDSDLISETESSPNTSVFLDMVQMSAYFLVRSRLKRLLNEHKNAKFLVTGHSLGGALAILFPILLLVNEENEVIERLLGVHTYGQPRIGNQKLCKFVEDNLVRPNLKYLRFVYCNDLVARLPCDNPLFFYKHGGACRYYNSFYVEKRLDEDEVEPNPNYYDIRYLIPTYVNAWWELMRSLIIGYVHGNDYEEGWLSLGLRLVGLVIPGLAAHCPTDYVNSVRLGK